MLKLCGGLGKTSQLAFKRRLTSGGNLDKRTKVDLGNPQAQQAMEHYLSACFVAIVIQQPSCRTMGLPSDSNAKVNFDT
eukprot:9288119-Pyramimonas_sp.AAC.1